MKFYLHYDITKKKLQQKVKPIEQIQSQWIFNKFKYQL